MHLKNFSLLREPDGAWNLSPAYDLVPAKILLPNDPEELALTLNGKKRRLTAADFAAFAASLRLTPVQYERTVKRLAKSLDTSLDSMLKASFLSPQFKASFQELLAKRIKTITSSAT